MWVGFIVAPEELMRKLRGMYSDAQQLLIDPHSVTMTETTYAARTSHAFVLTETATVAELIYKGATQEEIRTQVLVEDLFGLRSQVSRTRATNYT